MTDAAGGWTKGPWIAHKHFHCDECRRQNGNWRWEVLDADGKSVIDAGHNEQAATLAAEAFNVATETGLSPRQLAEQRAELIAALRNLCNEVDDQYRVAEMGIRQELGNAKYQCIMNRLDEAAGAIAHAEGR